MRKGWEMKTLGDVGSIFNGNSINENVKKEKYLNVEAGLPFIATKDVGYDNIVDYNNGVRIPFEEKPNFKTAPSNAIFICAEGGSAGRKICYIDREVCFGNKLFALVVKSDIDSRFVYYWYFSDNFQNDFKTSLAGIIGGVSLNKFREIQIPIPPFVVQQQIVSILDKAFAAIDKAKENLQRNLQNAKELFQSELNSVFENKGNGWVEKRLADVFILKPPKGEAKQQLSNEDYVTFFPMEDLKVFDRKIKPQNEKPLKDVFSSYTYFANEDVILAKITPCFENGKLGIARGLKNGIGFGSSEYIVFRSDGKVLPDFLFYFLSRDKFRIEGKNKMSGAVGHKRVSKDFVENYILCFPSLKEQKEIAQQLDILSTQTKNLENLYQKKSEALEELKKSILQKAFSGELSSPERALSANDGHSPSQKKKASSVKSPERA